MVESVVEAAQWCLVILAFLMNALFVFALKYMHRKKHIDALYFLQMIKSFNVLCIAIFTAVWDVHLKNGQSTTRSLCDFKDAIGVFLLDMYPVVHVIVALTRLRIVYCRGNLASLVTVPSTLRMTGLTITTALMVFLGFVLAFHCSHGGWDKEFRCSDTRNVIYITYEATEFCLYHVLPIICIPVLYFVICKKLSNTVCRKSLIRRGRPSTTIANMAKFTKILILVFLVTWLPYSVSRILSLFYAKETTLQCTQTFSKLMICIGHPLGEGLMQNGTFSGLAVMFKDLIGGNSRNTTQIFEPDVNNKVNEQHDKTAATEKCMPIRGSSETALSIPGFDIKRDYSDTLFELVTTV